MKTPSQKEPFPSGFKGFLRSGFIFEKAFPQSLTRLSNAHHQHSIYPGFVKFFFIFFQNISLRPVGQLRRAVELSRVSGFWFACGGLRNLTYPGRGF